MKPKAMKITFGILLLAIFAGCATTTTQKPRYIDVQYEERMEEYQSRLEEYKRQELRRSKIAQSKGHRGYKAIPLGGLLHELAEYNHELEDFLGFVVNGAGVRVDQIFDDAVLYRHTFYKKGYGGEWRVLLSKQPPESYYSGKEIKRAHYLITGFQNFDATGGGLITAITVKTVFLDTDDDLAKPIEPIRPRPY